MEGNKTSVLDKIKESTTISSLAEKLDISRPTAYKYIEIYASGSDEGLPANVKDYLDKLLTYDSEAVMDVEQRVMNEIESLRAEFEKGCENLEGIREKRRDDRQELQRMESSDSATEEAVKKKKAQIKAYEQPLYEAARSIKETHEKMTWKLDQLMEIERPANYPHYGYGEKPVKSVCYREDDKYIVFHTAGGRYSRSGYIRTGKSFRLELYVKIEGEPVLIGKYKPEEGGYFIIENNFPSVTKYYNICTYYVDPEDPYYDIDEEELAKYGISSDSTEYDIEFMTDIGWAYFDRSTGIKELVPQNRSARCIFRMGRGRRCHPRTIGILSEDDTHSCITACPLPKGRGAKRARS